MTSWIRKTDTTGFYRCGDSKRTGSLRRQLETVLPSNESPKFTSTDLERCHVSA